MKHLISSLLFSTAFALLMAVPVHAADSTCTPVYGGGQTCKPSEKIIIDKKIIHPVKDMAVDNLGVNDPKFKAGQEVRFSIAVRNVGDVEIKNLKLADTMADFVEFSEGSVEFTEEDGEFFYTITSLKPGETKVYEIVTNVVAVEDLPADQAVICVANRAAVAFGDQLAEDTANFCIQKDIIVTVVPGRTTRTVLPGRTVVTPGKTVMTPGKGGQVVVPGKGGKVITQVPGKGGQVIPPTTKGGAPVYPVPTETKTVPQTGPELMSLLGLLSTAGAGLFIRSKAK